MRIAIMRCMVDCRNGGGFDCRGTMHVSSSIIVLRLAWDGDDASHH